MAATETRPATRPGPGFAWIRGRPRGVRETVPLLLGLGLGATVLYAAFASGAVGIADAARVEVWIAAVSLGGLAALLFGRSLRFAPSSAAAVGLGLLVAFAAWCALSVVWSVAPDETWREANRAISYALAAGLGIAVGGSLWRAAERVALGYLAVATAVAAYALAGKALPWVEIPGVLDLNHAERLARLHEPLGYWNALAVFLVMAIPTALQAASAGRSLRTRSLALAALVGLLTAVVLTYSRGGLLVLGAALGVQLALAPERRGLITAGLAALVGAAPASIAGLTLNDLTRDRLAEGSRVDGGLVFLALLVAGVVAAFLLARFLSRPAAGPMARPRPVLALGACLVGVAVLVGTVAIAESGSVEASRTPSAGSLASVRDEDAPSRLLSTDPSHRWTWWGEAISAWRDEPVAGHGAGSFPLLHRLYRDNELQVRQAHSMPLQLLAETGLIGAALALLGLLLLASGGAREAIGRRDPRERGFAVALLAGVAAWGLHLLVDWDWQIPALTVAAVAGLGVLAARPRAGGERSVRRARPSLSAGPGTLGALLALGSVGLCLVMASAALPALARSRTDSAFLAASTASRSALGQAERDADSAKRLDPYSVEPLFAAAAVAERQGRLTRAGQLLAEAARRQPENPEVWIQLGLLQVQLNDAPGALRSSLRARRLDPFESVAVRIALFGSIDERASASATGTPLLPQTQPVVPLSVGQQPLPPAGR